MATKKAVSEKAVEVKAIPKIGKALAASKEADRKSVATAKAAKVKVTQLVGTIGRRHDQEATLVGLGLNKRHKSRVLEDTAAVRGMIYKVRHLVKVEQIS